MVITMKKTSGSSVLLRAILRGIFVGTSVLVLLVLLSPFVLMRLPDPSAAVPASVTVIAAAAAFFASLFACLGPETPKLIPTLGTAAFLILLLFLLSFIFEKETLQRDDPFSLLLCGVILLFSFLGSLASRKKKRTKRRSAARQSR